MWRAVARPFYELRGSFLEKVQKFLYLRLSPSHTTDKLKSVFSPATRYGGFTDNSDWIASRHHIAEVMERGVSEVQAYKDYIKNSEFETGNIFGWENIQMTQPDQNIPLTGLNKNIPLTRMNQNIPMTRHNENIQMTRLNENIPMT